MGVDDKIKVFDAEDNKLKILGELLSNDTSRKIIRMLIQQECYTNEISTKLNIRVSLVIHHLKKLEQIGVLEINHKQIVKKGNHHRYFRMMPGLFITPNETKENLDKKGILKKIFKDGIKFASIGIAGMITWFISTFDFTPPGEWNAGEQLYYNTDLSPLVITLIVILIGLIVERIFSIIKKKG